MRTASGGISAVAIAAVLLTLLLVSPATALQVGEKAPDFTLTAPGGKQVKLADLLGKGPVVIYTFIQAFTPT
jgi:thioredoxin-dependent peroxiredoxin